MPEPTRAFTTAAKRRSDRTFTIDDEVFHIAPVGLNIADKVAEFQGMLPAAGTTPSAEQLLEAARPFITAEDFDRFAAYCQEYVAPSEFGEIVQFLMGEVTGRDPSQRASSADGSSLPGTSSTDGVAPEVLTPSTSPSTVG